MEKQLSLESSGQLNGSAHSYHHALTSESIQVSNGFGENEDLVEDIVKELDSYWEDIDVRLTISRMVNDSVIRGMVNAVEQEAACKIAQKELELERLKETLHLYHVSSYENESVGASISGSESNTVDHGLCSSSSDSLGKLKNDTQGQLKNLREEIDLVRGGKFMRRINSGSDLVGLGGILREDISEKCRDCDASVDLLSSSVGHVFEQVDNIARLSKALVSSWELEHQYQEGIESLVIANCIHGLQEQFERQLWDQMQLKRIERTKFVDKMKEISSFRQELDAISESLSSVEAGHHMFHGSMVFGDHFHHLGLGNHVSLLTSHREANGKHKESLTTVQDNTDSSHREANGKHEESVAAVHDNMDSSHREAKEDSVQYYKGEMAKMKIDHDYQIRELTEYLYNLKGKYLKEKGHTRSLPPRKDKEFDVLRSKIPDVITRLDEILLEYAKLPALDKKDDSLDCLKERLDTLLSENCQLRDSLEEKKKEVDLLSAQVSETVQKMSQHSLAEANLLLMKENLESAVVDARIEASIGEDVCKCIFNDVIYDVKCAIQESDEENNVMKEIYEIILEDAASKATLGGSLEFEDSWLESITEKELVGIIFKEALNAANKKLNDLSQDVFDKDTTLRLEIMEKETQIQEMLLLKASVEEKEKLLQEALIAFEKEKIHHLLISKELEDARLQRNQEQILSLKCNEESSDLKCKLSDALERIKLQEAEKNEINEKFDQAIKELSNSSEEKRSLLAVIQEKENSLSSAESRENTNREQMESAIALLQGLLHQVDEFKEQVEGNLERTDLRLRCLGSQLSDIGQKANILKKMGAQCKQRLERKTSDLHKAETEVDLLGDEVAALLSLLEKIYIALDHYSPVLRHYPGIVEILNLVRRELGGETTRHGQSLKKSNIL